MFYSSLLIVWNYSCLSLTYPYTPFRSLHSSGTNFLISLKSTLLSHVSILFLWHLIFGYPYNPVPSTFSEVHQDIENLKWLLQLTDILIYCLSLLFPLVLSFSSCACLVNLWASGQGFALINFVSLLYSTLCSFKRLRIIIIAIISANSRSFRQSWVSGGVHMCMLAWTFSLVGMVWVLLLHCHLDSKERVYRIHSAFLSELVWIKRNFLPGIKTLLPVFLGNLEVVFFGHGHSEACNPWLATAPVNFRMVVPGLQTLLQVFWGKGKWCLMPYKAFWAPEILLWG